jgi:putative colanic acid biosynthesis glycosyltransferase
MANRKQIGIQISIITVTWNDPQGLRKTLESIPRLPSEIEWIIQDGDSTHPEQKAILEDLQTKENTRVFIEKDRGIYDAMNKGINSAMGQYAIFLNGGDTLIEGNIFKIAKKIARCKSKPLAIACSFNRIGRDKIAQIKPKTHETLWLHSLPTSHQAILYNIDAFSMARHSLKYTICGDFHFWCQTIRTHGRKRFATVNLPITNFYTGGISSNKPLLLISEAAHIQWQQLSLSILLIAPSTIMRVASILKSLKL